MKKIALAILLLGISALCSANSALTLPFLITNGQVLAITATASTLYVGGNFSWIGPRTGGAVALDLVTGNAPGSFAQVDNGSVYAAQPDGSGGWFLGGDFTQVDGQPRNRLAHLLADYSLDPNWHPSADATVQTLALMGSSLYVGGNFTTVNSGASNRSYLASFNVINGSLDAWNPSFNASVTCLTATGSTLYVGGNFTLVTGAVTRSHAAAFVPPSTGATNFDPELNATAYAVAISGTAVYMGGSFTQAGTITTQALGSFDGGTGSELPFFFGGITGFVDAIGTNSTNIFVGGSFIGAGGSTRYELAAFDTTGHVTAYAPSPQIVGEVFSMQVTDSAVYLGGNLTVPSGNLGAYDASTGGALAWSSPAEGPVEALQLSGSTLFVAGQFAGIGGALRANLASVGLATGSLTSWNPGSPGQVNALALSAINLYVGGLFSGIASFNLSSGASNAGISSLYGTRCMLVSGASLYAGGDFGAAAFDLSGTLLWQDSISGPSNTVYALDAMGNTLFAGGSFTGFNTIPHNNIVAVDPILGGPMAWAPNPNGAVRTLSSYGGLVYAGGDFTNFSSTARSHLAAFDPGTGALKAWNPNADNSVNALTSAYGDIYAGGSFQSVGGGLTARSDLAAFDSVTGVATSWDPEPNFPIYALCASGTDLYLGGSFTGLGGLTRTALALVADTSLYSPTNTPTATPTNTPTASPTATPTRTATASATQTPSFTVTPVFFTPVTVGIYNAAAELLASPSAPNSDHAISSLMLSPPSPWDPSSSTLLISDGNWSTTYDGNNASAQPLPNGTYFLKVSSMDQFGTVLTVTTSITIANSSPAPTYTAVQTASPTPSATATYTASPTPAVSGTPTPSMTSTPADGIADAPAYNQPGQGSAFVYPEPVTGKSARLALDMRQAGTAKALIFNNAGSVVAKIENSLGQGVQALPMDLSSFAPGIYYFQVSMHYDSGGTETVQAGKFAVLR